MGEAISKEVKELAEKAEAMLPKIKFETSDKLPQIDTTSSKELASTLGNLAKKISETTSASLANIQKKISESTANSIANLQKKTNESTALGLAALSKKIGESSTASAVSLTNLQKRITTNCLPAFAKKINEATVASLSGLEKKIQQSTAKAMNIERSLEAVCKKQGVSSQRLSAIEGILNEFVKNKSNFDFGKLGELQKQLATKNKEIVALNNRLGRVYRIIKVITTLLLLTTVAYFAYRYYKQHHIPGKVQKPNQPRDNEQRGY